MKSPLVCALLAGAFSAFSAPPPFVNNQAARALIGQNEFTQLATTAANNIIGSDSGIAFDPVNNYLWESSGNLIGLPYVDNRVLGFSLGQIPDAYADLSTYGGPSSSCNLCGFPASVVLGQVDFASTTGGRSQVAGSTSAGSMSTPTAVATDGHYLVVVDTGNDRVLLWNTVPLSSNAPPDVVLGQPDFTTLNDPTAISASSFRGPQGAWIQNGRLFVADTGNNRVLIWNSIPTRNNQPADLVLGQSSFTSNTAPPVNANAQPVAAANLLWNPMSVTVSPDGTHLFVADFAYNRVLIWNSIPTQNQQPADVEVGQKDMTGSTSDDVNNLCSSSNDALCEKTLNQPRFALSDGTRLFIADSGNDRVLVYNTIPTTNAAAADAVLGQPDFISDVRQPNSSTITQFVSNVGAVNTTPTPTSLAWDGKNLYVADPTDSRILVFTPGDIAVPGNELLNNASETVRQEGLIVLSGKAVSGDTVTATISVNGNSTNYTYTIKSGDTLTNVVTGVVNAINANSGDPYVTAQSSNVPDTVLLFAKSSSADLNTIGYSASTSNATDITTATAGTYLTGGTSSTLAPGTLFEIDDPSGSLSSGGLVDFPFQAASTTQIVPTIMKGPAGTKSSVEVFVDGFAVPVLSASPTQVVAQVPYSFINTSTDTVDRTSISIYLRSVRKDGSVLITSPAPAAFTDANPGLYAAANATEPRPALGAMHQAGNPSVTVTLSGTITAGNSVSITVAGTAYSHTVTSSDSLNTIAQALASQINSSGNSSVTATAGANATVLISARQSGSAGVGVSVTAAVGGSSPTETAATSTASTCCATSGTGLVTVSNPAVANEVITFLATGLGAVADSAGNLISVPVGTPYSGPQPNTAGQLVNSTVNGGGTTVTSAGLPGGAIGVYQVQVQMPGSLPTTGVVPVYIAQGAFISNTVTVPVGPPTSSGSSGSLRLDVDSPNGTTRTSNVLVASGWTIDPNAEVPSIVLSLDGNQLPAPTRVARIDVCALFSTAPDCEFGGTPGWSETIDTSSLSAGTHTLTITATAVNGDTASVPVAFTEAPNTLTLDIDSPQSGQTVTGPFDAYGWAGDPNGTVTSTVLALDGVQLAAPGRMSRPDVCAAQPSLQDCQGGNTPGFAETINAGPLGPGSHTLSVTATASNGDIRTKQVTFNVVHDLRLDIDAPQTGATVSGTTTVAGWATSAAASMPANNVILRIDGGPSIATVSTARGDVCAAITDSYDCAHGNSSVGFAASVDTTQYANGTHTLLISAVDSNGTHRTMTTTFIVSNSVGTLLSNVDLPAPGQTLVGQVNLYGWAGAPSASLSAVAIAIDGVQAGTATLSVRGDVCIAHPTLGGCPGGNVGWSYALDTTSLPDGQHQLQVTAYTTAGVQTQTVTFTVANWTTATPMHVFIDFPGITSTVSGLMTANGWAISDESAIASVAVTVDGVPVNATYGGNRSDVCAAFPGRAGCPDVGWTAQVDTTQLTNGLHTLSATAKSANGQTYTVATGFNVGNKNSGIQLFVDTNLSGTLNSPLQISGWAGASTAVTAVKLSVDGNPVGQTTENIARPDVCAAHPTLFGCPAGMLGWSLAFDPGLYAPGTHVLGVTAVTASGSFTQPVTINIAQPSTPVMTVFIDQPAPQTSLVGTVTLSGWDADTNGNGGTVTISIDGVPVVTNLTYSTRGDVCAARHYSTTCANVGWSGTLDTTVLPEGPHTLSVSATSSAGSATVSQGITVANWTNLNPIQITIDNPVAGTPLSGTAVLSGWAYSSTAPVSTVLITIDNLIVAQPATYGISRTDVCQGVSNCPNVGWNYTLDTTTLPDGVHTLSITALTPFGGELSGSGQQNTITTNFTVQNY